MTAASSAKPKGGAKTSAKSKPAARVAKKTGTAPAETAPGRAAAKELPKIRMRDASAPSVKRPREFAKSAKTRIRILESAVDCLVEVGYARMSTGMVAERAQIARSAMQYHFPTRADLLAGLVRHVHYEWSRRYAEAVAASADRGKMSAIDIYWEHVQQPLFIAYSELHFAARTDRELAEILEPIAVEHERDRVAISRRLYPDVWDSDPDAFPLFRDISRFVIEGMALSMIAYRRKERVSAVLQFMKDMRREVMTPPRPAKASRPRATAAKPARNKMT